MSGRCFLFLFFVVGPRRLGLVLIDWLGLGNRDNVCKGYANVGLIENLENTVASISGVPATYDVSLKRVFELGAGVGCFFAERL